jgi:hypothetical protein
VPPADAAPVAPAPAALDAEAAPAAPEPVAPEPLAAASPAVAAPAQPDAARRRDLNEPRLAPLFADLPKISRMTPLPELDTNSPYSGRRRRSDENADPSQPGQAPVGSAQPGLVRGESPKAADLAKPAELSRVVEAAVDEPSSSTSVDAASRAPRGDVPAPRPDSEAAREQSDEDAGGGRRRAAGDETSEVLARLLGR